ncbi:MAG: rhodanese-like domain-containing protein [Desulfobulbaceae bacterium]|nr:rhodanese-like domain-containing protein [Desulfobulbaceae bacterium]
MRWLQFLTPVDSVNSTEAKEMIQNSTPGELILLDVRQPKEYEAAHLPGAILLPLGQLDERVGELDRGKKFLIY